MEGAATWALEDPREAVEPRAQLRNLPGLAAPETPDAVAVLTVPLGPSRREATDLVAVLTQIPGLGDELHLGQHGILHDHVEEGSTRVHVARLPRQHPRAGA